MDVYIGFSVATKPLMRLSSCRAMFKKNDLVTGPYDEKLQNDMRSFESVAKEDGKQLLCVYAYMKEFDDIGEYFFDHFQKANGESVLMSGARMAGG